MNKKQYFRDRASEAGVALVFALAMLALLLIMLIGFLASSIFEQRIAYNQSGQSITRTIARSALQRAASVLAVYDDVADEIPAFTGYADNGTGTLNGDTVRRMVPVSSYNTASVNNMDNDQADTLVKKLLKFKGLNADNYSWDKDNKPQWVPLIVDASSHKHITGRYAYTIIPNLGIEPELLNSAEPTKRIGGQYKELPFSGLELADSKWSRIFNKSKWMSLDMLGSRYVLGNSGDNPWKTNLSANDKAREDFKEKDATTFMEAVNTFFTTSQERTNYDDGRIDLSQVGTQANANEIADLITSDSNLKKQIAANIVDFVDTDNIPTSDVTPKNWLTQTPSYSGLEKTPYINQIVPAFEVKGTYSVQTTSKNILQNTVTRKIDFTHRGRVFVELINIYPQNLTNVRRIVLKDVKLTVTGEIRFGTSLGNTFVAAIGGSNNSRPVDTVFRANEVTIYADGGSGSDITVAKNNYAVVSADVDFSGSIQSQTDTRDMLKNLGRLNSPAVDVNLKIKDFGFERAVLFDKDGNGVDYVKGMSIDGEENFVGSVENATMPLLPDTRNAWVFNSNNQTITSVAYANFETKDPRCNLGNSDDWSEPKFEHGKETLPSDKNLPGSTFDLALKAANRDAKDMKNDDLKEEQDIEVAEDPAKVSTGYIRNGVMQSVWELGVIHRGKQWQTINLKSTDDSKEKSYFNDGVLLDEIAFYDPALTADEKNTEKTKKFNINYPYMHFAAFGPLAKGLKYCPVSENIIADDGKLYADDGTKLTEAQWQSLRKWIALKCYESKDGNASKFDGAKNYHFYRHRGYLANVVTDWAVNCPDSPYNGKDLMDAYLEEIVSKIAPLTRAGEPYEYFTIYAVAQSIKDVGGLNSNKTISRYDRTGTLKEGECQQGKWEENFDEVTGEVYLVARVRRVLSCKDKDSCRDGRHDKDCKYSIQVIESYTINEL